MKTIYKYGLHVRDDFIVKLPKGAEVLTVQVQYVTPCIWVLVDDLVTEMEERRFGFIGTGHSAPFIEKENYIGTIQENGGGFIWHLFEYKRG